MNYIIILIQLFSGQSNIFFKGIIIYSYLVRLLFGACDIQYNISTWKHNEKYNHPYLMHKFQSSFSEM